MRSLLLWNALRPSILFRRFLLTGILLQYRYRCQAYPGLKTVHIFTRGELIFIPPALD